MITLMMKKKRKAIRDTENIFYTSKKTQRTPTKSQKQEGDKLDLLLNMVTEMKADQKFIKEEIQHIRSEQDYFRNEIKRLTKENKELKEENEKVRKENKEIKQELKEIRRSMDMYDKERKKNNIILSGIKMDIEDQMILKEAIENIIKNYLELDIKIKKVKKIGNKTCLVELNKEEEKTEIIQNKHKLKEIKTEQIYINEDLTRGEMEKRRQLREKAKEEKSKGKTVKIGYNKITVDGKEWRWNNREKKIEAPCSSKN